MDLCRLQMRAGFGEFCYGRSPRAWIDASYVERRLRCFLDGGSG